MRFNRELLKGNTGTIVLAILSEGPLHGYEIAKEMRRRSDDALRLGQGVLYPILHRLEAQGLIAGEWEQNNGTPSRRRYVITERGLDELRAKRSEWQAFTRAMAQVLDGSDGR
jgi:DNA-binding PadR family transcriptional regulator